MVGRDTQGSSRCMEIELTAGETVRAISAIVSIHEEEHGEHANTPRGRATDNDMLNVRVDANAMYIGLIHQRR